MPLMVDDEALYWLTEEESGQGRPGAAGTVEHTTAASDAGLTRWRALCGGSFFYCGEDFFRFRVVGGVPGGDLAVFAEEDGGEGVGDGLGVGVGDAYGEEVSYGGEVFFGGRGEVPVGEGLFGVVAGVGSAVAAEDLGGVVGGIEADAEEVGPVVEGGVGGQGFVYVGEVAGHAGAEVGQGAAGVDEGDEDDLALEPGEMDGAVALVEEVEVGDVVAGVGDVVLDGGLVVGAGLGDDDDVVELGVAEAGGVLLDDDFGGDAVAGVELADDAGVLELVGHGHGFH